MASPHPNSFANSPYADQLRQGFDGLRFGPALEAEFARYHLASMIRRIRVWQVFTLLLGVGTLVLRARAVDSVLDPVILVRLLILLPLSLLLVWASWSPQYERWYPQALRWAFPPLYAVAMMLAADVASEGRATVITFPVISLFAAALLIGAMFYRALFLMAVIVGGYLAGAVYFQLPGAILGYHALLLVVVWLVSAILAYTVEKSQRTSFLQNGLMSEMVSQDGLTGLYNRRAFDQHVVSSWQQALRDRRSLGILMIDVDHFKRYNDRYGHQAGDAALKQVAQVVQEVSRRPLDMAARYGGEEFAVVLYDLADGAVEDIAERVRDAVQRLGIPHADSPHGVVTASIGVALVRPTLERSPAGAVQLADEALYMAKNGGRNGVKVLIHEESALATGQFRHRAAGPGPT